MKTAIIYFSGTGNNLYVAKMLSNLIEAAELLSFKDLENRGMSLNDFECIIFCVPSYHSHIPNYVESVLSKMNFINHHKIYTVVCCGGNRGHAIEDVRERVEENGGSIAGEYMVVLPGSYIFKYNGFPEIVINLEMFFAKRKISQIAKLIIAGKKHVYRYTGLFYRKSDEPRLKEAITNYHQIGLEMQASGACIGCKTCERVCPVNNINVNNHRPEFGDNCQQCMACVQWCPKKAIDWNNKSEKRRHYHNPEIGLSDMTKQDVS